MKNGQRMCLNLASHPARNLRLFFTLAGVLGALLLLLLVLGVGNVVRYGFQNRTTRSNLFQMDQRIAEAAREEKQFVKQVSEAVRDRQRNIDSINQVIYRKSFSWIKMLNSLEELLPDRCYIVSLAPAFHENTVMDLRFKIASPDLENWMNLVDRLYEQGFERIRLDSQTRGANGFFIYEMSVRYERDI